MQNYNSLDLGNVAKYGYIFVCAPVAQLDRVLLSEGKGQTFESSRVRQLLSHFFVSMPISYGYPHKSTMENKHPIIPNKGR